MSSEFLSLHQILPDDVVANNGLRFIAYRNYPVFSWPWLKKRSLLFFLVILLFFGAPVALGVAILKQDVIEGLRIGLSIFLSFVVMSSAGVALATWIRHRRFTVRIEQIAIVLAILFGIAAALLTDQWVSADIEKSLDLSQPAVASSEFQGQAASKLGVKVGSGIETRASSQILRAINLFFLILIYSVFGGGLALRSYFSEAQRLAESQRRREVNSLRLQHEENALRLSVLQAQIEPHFLFNTMASLRSLIRQDPARAELTIDALVDHLRATIPKFREDSGKVASTLGQQIDICTSYLTLMQIRIGTRLQYHIEVSASDRDLEFPPLILISLVENAIKHAVEAKTGLAKIDIHSKLSPDGNKLCVSVLDNGPGLNLGLGGGLGLSNIREQLKTRFGQSASLSISNRPEGGVIASIELPTQISKD
jgi:hypothetical protein